MEEEQLSDPIDAPQMAYRIESHLTNVGPLYLFSEDENGNPWVFPGEGREGMLVPKRGDLGRMGGVVRMELTSTAEATPSLLRGGDVTALGVLWMELKSTAKATPLQLGAGGRDCTRRCLDGIDVDS